MRAYGIVSPMFWTGESGKRFRADRDAQVLALYLMTGPHAHQTGMYYLPLMYLSHETGIAQKGASKALQTLDTDGFSVYDEKVEWVWVREMAAWQIGRQLSEVDKRAKGVQQYLQTVPERPFKGAFIRRYRDDFHLKSVTSDAPMCINGGASKVEISPLQGDSSYQIRTDQDQEQAPSGPPNGHSKPNGHQKPRATKRMPEGYVIPPEERAKILAELPTDFDIDREEAKLRDYTFRQAHSDWLATYRNWMRKGRDDKSYAKRELPPPAPQPRWG